jgi:hypothetical protein
LYNKQFHIPYEFSRSVRSESALTNENCSEEVERYKRDDVGSFFGNFTTNKSERAEEAFELYKQAATNFKMAKMWDDAANAYLESV